MRDEDAFLRAIAAAPADDAPRLVYADWLDERGDPRGIYLRAELKWARPWRSPGCPPPSGELPKVAGRLDALWVFRVSRPPRGVCCDHLTFKDGGPAVTADQLDAVEARLGINLPLDLRAFFLNRNGGLPDPEYYFPKGAKRQTYPSIVGRFYSAPDRSMTARRTSRKKMLEMQQRDLEYNTDLLYEHDDEVVARCEATRARVRRGPREFIPIAAEGRGHIAVGLSGRRQGKVYHVNRQRLVQSNSPRLVADSFPEFLSMVRLKTFDPVSA
jgi:uncharacterized protein (TIGR02996 family)